MVKLLSKRKRKRAPLIQCFGGVLLNFVHFFKLLIRNYGIINFATSYFRKAKHNMIFTIRLTERKCAYLPPHNYIDSKINNLLDRCSESLQGYRG